MTSLLSALSFTLSLLIPDVPYRATVAVLLACKVEELLFTHAPRIVMAFAPVQHGCELVLNFAVHIK